MEVFINTFWEFIYFLIQTHFIWPAVVAQFISTFGGEGCRHY